MSPSVARALVTKNGKLFQEEIPIPKPGNHQLLVKVSHVAQNPTDVQSLDSNAFGDGAVLGCDFVGIVEDVGPNVRRIAKGTKIAGLIWGGEIKGLGGYSTYTLADERICFPLPSNLAPEDAATVPLAACTAWLALFSQDCLNIDRSKSGQSVLIWGGSSSVGVYAIQIATMQGLQVVTTCSPRHHDFVRRLGATHVFDYRGAEVSQKIKDEVPDLKYVFDTIGNEGSSSTAASAIHPGGGALCTVRPGKAFTENIPEFVKITDVLVWTAFFKEHRYGKFHWPAHAGDHKLSVELFDALHDWLSNGKLKPNYVKLYEKGLDDVPQGFQEYRDGKISNYKIVYSM